MPEDIRKLAAIVFIDIVGYTAMMLKEVNHTLEIVDKNLIRICEGAIKFHSHL